MATKSPANAFASTGRVTIYAWTDVAETDTVVALSSPYYRERTVQVVGTFNGGTVSLHGSIDGTNYQVLEDPDGSPLDFTASDIETIREVVRFYKPVLTGAGMEVSVYILGAE